MMGSGKSYWMDRLSRKLKLRRYDLDQLIEDVEDRSIQQIFTESGEEHFRKMESIVLKWFADRDDFILATGGGTPCFFDNMEWMNQQGLTIWLDEDIPQLVERLLPEKKQRPLLSGLADKEIEGFLQKRLGERAKFYSQARLRLSGPGINEKNLIQAINEYQNA